MFSYRQAQAKESETEKLLNTNNFTLEDLLKKPDIANAYRNNNAKLLGYLLKEKHIEELFDLLMQSDERSMHKIIISLFQTNNTDLHRVFADSINLSEYAFKSLEPESTKNGCYAAGTMSRILSRAMDMWAVETHQVFSHSDNLYRIIIQNIDQTCVYYTVQDLISSDTHPLELFIWCLFQSIAGEEFIKNDLKGKCPRTCYLNKMNYHLPDFHKERNESKDQDLVLDMKLKKALELLHLFFKKKKNNHKLKDFRQFTLTYILSIFDTDEFIPLHLELARELGPNKDLLDKVILKLRSQIEEQSSSKIISNDISNMIDQCLGYLTKFASSISTPDFLGITISLLDERFTQFTLLNLVEFVRRFFEKNERDGIKDALKTIDNLIIYGWNVFTYDDKQALKSPEAATENKLESECLLLKSIIFDLWRTAHLPEIQTQSSKETQYADDIENPEEDENNDFMRSQYGGNYGSSNNDDDDNSDEKKNAQEIQKNVQNWSETVLGDNQNNQFTNDVKIWFETDYLNSVNDAEPSQNQLRLDKQFPNLTDDIINDVNQYRWGKKFPEQISVPGNQDDEDNATNSEEENNEKEEQTDENEKNAEEPKENNDKNDDDNEEEETTKSEV